MSSIMNDIEKIQVAVRTCWRICCGRRFTALGLLFVVLQKDWKLALVSLTVLPFVLVPTRASAGASAAPPAAAQDNAAELNQILQETLSGHQVVKAFGTEEFESSRFRHGGRSGCKSSNLRYVRQQALASPLIEFFGALTIVGLLTYARTQIKSGYPDRRRVHQFRDRAADAV